MVLLAGCAGEAEAEKPTTPDAAAAQLATALSKGSLENIRVREGDPGEELPILLKGMNGMLPEVTVAYISPSAQVANVKLAYKWPLSSPWTYESDARLVRNGDEWKLNWDPTVLHPKLTDTTRLERQRGDSSERGNITGLGEVPLVENRPMQMLGLDKTGLTPDEVGASALQVAEKAQIDPEAYVAKAHAAGATAFVDAAPVRQNELPSGFLMIKGASMRTVTISAPETVGYARALIGTIGYATADQAREAGFNVAEGDLIGVSGLQRTYDKDLRGSTGNRVFLAERDAPVGSGRPTKATLLADFPDVPGKPLSTTIDDRIQTAAESVLKDVQVPASVVVLRTGTGAILAAADSPLARRKDDSTTGRMGPGLAASPVAALALMRSGVKLDDRVECKDEVTIDGRTFANDDSYYGRSGRITLTRAMSDECVTAVAEAAQRLDGAKLPEAARSLGLGQNLDVGVPVEMGSFPAPPDAVAKAEAVTGEGGRGQIQASTLALATMAASVQAKRVVSPFVVPGREPKVDNAVPLSDAEARTLQSLMEDGAGSHRPLTGVATGRSDGRIWAVGYSNTYAVAVVMKDDKQTWVTPAQIVRAVATTSSR